MTIGAETVRALEISATIARVVFGPEAPETIEAEAAVRAAGIAAQINGLLGL